MRIGELARRTGVTVETIRYYEKRGLLSPSTRLASGYREFSSDAISQIGFIGRAQSLGFSLTEVEELTRLRARAWAGDATTQLRDAAVKKLRDVDARLRVLTELRQELANLIDECDRACPVGVNAVECAPSFGVAPADVACPLVDALEAEGSNVRSADRRDHAPRNLGGSTVARRPPARREPTAARATTSMKRRAR